MATPTLAADLRRLEEEAALLHRPDIETALTPTQLAALRAIEDRIAVIRKALGP